jgi:hypothetical protein
MNILNKMWSQILIFEVVVGSKVVLVSWFFLYEAMDGFKFCNKWQLLWL